MYRYLIVISVLAILISSQCSESREGVHLDMSELPYARLSDYGFYDGRLSEMMPSEGVLPYDLITPLFTDYAFKKRYIYTGGKAAEMGSSGRVLFADGSVIIKNFYYPHDFRAPEDGHDMIETRLLVRDEGEWQAYSYIWDEDDHDAELSRVGGYRDVSWIDESGERHDIQYNIPNQNQCKGCHSVDDVLMPIGPKYKNLNHEYKYASGTQNQVQHWIAQGHLMPNEDVNPYTLTDWQDETASLHDRAISYLEINCSHCHEGHGPAHTTGLYLNADHANLTQLGICKTPVAAGKGSGGREYSIQPGDAEQSIMIYRLASTDPGIMMPELGRTTTHTEGVALLSKWIESLDVSCGEKRTL